MTDDRFGVTVASGTCRTGGPLLSAPHVWTPDGVTVEGAFTGAHLLHLAVGGCVLNDVHREAQARDIAIDGVRVEVAGGFDTTTWTSTGITYRVRVDSTADARDVALLLDRVEAVAEIPKAVAAGASVTRST